jgi:hypothetical protein
MFADLVWYFLRSTDGLVHTKIEAIVFEPPGADISEEFSPSAEVTFKDLDEPPGLSIWLHPSGFTF